MRTKILSLIILMLSCSLALSGCFKSKGLKIGFNYEINLRMVMGAVKSEHTSFAVDDVTLDFYFGGSAIEYPPDSEHRAVGVALYFCNEKAYRNLDFGLQYASYKDIEGMYFVKLISPSDFNSGDYDVDVTLIKGKVFQHNEVLTVPKEVFISDDDHFGLAFIQFCNNKSEDGNYVSRKNCFVVQYEFLNDETIELMKPSHLF